MREIKKERQRERERQYERRERERERRREIGVDNEYNNCDNGHVNLFLIGGSSKFILSSLQQFINFINRWIIVDAMHSIQILKTNSNLHTYISSSLVSTILCLLFR